MFESYNKDEVAYYIIIYLYVLIFFYLLYL